MTLEWSKSPARYQLSSILRIERKAYLSPGVWIGKLLKEIIDCYAYIDTAFVAGAGLNLALEAVKNLLIQFSEDL